MKANTLIKFDWAAKRLLRQKANFGVLEGFISTLLGETIKIVEILESESNQEHEKDKYNRVDIKAKNSKDEIIIIEIQNYREVHYLERSLYGVSKAITEHMELGSKDYSSVKKVYSISILYFDMWNGDDYAYHGQNKFVGLNTGHDLMINVKQKEAILPKHPEEIFPEYYILRVDDFEFNKVSISPLEEWMMFLKEGIINDDTTTAGLVEAKEKLKYYNMSQQEQREYESYLSTIMIQNDVIGNAKAEGLVEGHAEGLAKGLEKGLAKGRTEGIDEEKYRIAKLMKSEGESLSKIKIYTGLSEEEIILLTSL